MGAPANEAELNGRRYGAIAALAYAYMAAAYRESPSASGIHAQFVRWYIANRGLYGVEDARLQSLERTLNQRLTSELGYTQISGYAIGIALTYGASLDRGFVPVFRTPPPRTASAIPAWIDSTGFFAAADRVPGIDYLDRSLSVTLDPLQAPAMAGQQAAFFVQNGTWATITGPTPGAELPAEYNGSGGSSGKPSGGSGGGAMAYQPDAGSSSSTSLTTTSSSLPRVMRTAGPAQVAVGVVGVGVVGYVLYLVAKRVKK